MDRRTFMRVLTDTVDRFGAVNGNGSSNCALPEAEPELVSALSAELEELKVDVVVTTGPVASQALRTPRRPFPSCPKRGIRCSLAWSPAWCGPAEMSQVFPPLLPSSQRSVSNTCHTFGKRREDEIRDQLV